MLQTSTGETPMLLSLHLNTPVTKWMRTSNKISVWFHKVVQETMNLCKWGKLPVQWSYFQVADCQPARLFQIRYARFRML